MCFELRVAEARRMGDLVVSGTCTRIRLVLVAPIPKLRACCVALLFANAGGYLLVA